jgi:hypothetical protein
MITFICNLERNGQTYKAIVKAETKEVAEKDLSVNWNIHNIIKKV